MLSHPVLNRALEFARHLRSPAALRPYASIGEQILMSGSNMVASLVVVRAAGIEWFGIYSFILTLGTFASGAFATLLHRQMLLAISDDDEEPAGTGLLSTLAVELALMLVGLLALALLLTASATWLDVDRYRSEIIGACLYLCLFNLFDLFKQFLYTRDEQVYSFRCTAVFVTLQLAFLGYILLRVDADNVVTLTFLTMGISLFVSLGTNMRCLRALGRASWKGWRGAGRVLAAYFEHARFSLLGMSVTWLQNQSMHPFLMFVGGPVAVGYFNLARLIVTPIAVVNQGLVNSTTPQLRRAFKNEGVHRLKERIVRLQNANLLFAGAYAAGLALLHVTGLFDRFVPGYAEVRWYLLIWILMLFASTCRFWMGQFFVVGMEFRYLLGVGVIAMLVTMSGMLGTGLAMGEMRIALLFVIVGELVSLILMWRRRQRVLGEV